MVNPLPIPSDPEQSLWFYADASNQPQGPVTREELSWLVAAGTIHPSTAVIEVGGSEWKTYADFVTMPPVSEVPPALTSEGEKKRTHWFLTPLSVVVFSPVLGLLLLWKRRRVVATVLGGLLLACFVCEFATHISGSETQPSTGKNEIPPLLRARTAPVEKIAACEPPKEYQNEPIAVALSGKIEEDDGKFIVRGKALREDGTNLADSFFIFVHVETRVGGVIVQSDGIAILKDGCFEISPASSFDGSNQFPAGEYAIQVTLNPQLQMTAQQAILGKNGANLTGSQVQTNKDGGKTAFYEQRMITIDSPEAEQTTQRIAAELAARRTEFGALYRELQGFKDDPSFWSRGFSREGREDWLLRVRNAGAKDKTKDRDYGNRLAAMLETLGASYQRSKGTETDLTRHDLKWFMWDFRLIAPEYQGLGTPFHGIIRLVKKLNAGTTTIKQAKAQIVLKGMGDVFEVASTCEQYAFYKTSDDADTDEDIQIAVEREPGKFFGDGARLKQHAFQVVDVSRFSTVSGAGIDLVILRAIPE